MKKLIITSILALLVTAGSALMAQDYPDEYLGLPGDNLNLYAVMKLFQESETLEGFERNLNNENSRINNLDLNGDNLIDYITVSDYVNGNVHTIVLRVALSRNETQDVAVFTVERFRDGSVQIQLIGDEALYGRNYIVEPIYDETPNPGYTGRSRNTTTVTVIRTTPYEVAGWPLVRFIYLPSYSIWHSSWYWGYYPSYWHPWRPYYWHYYYGYHYNWYHHYYSHYHHWHQPRYAHYHDYYYNKMRSHSPLVSNRINEGHYRATYSRPEQRSEGEALFTKLHPSQTRRTADNTINRSTTRPSAGQNANATRRATDISTERATSRPAQSQSTEAATRRAPASTTERATSRPAQSQSTVAATRRAPASTTERATSRPPQSQSTVAATRRAPASTTERAAPRPAQSQRPEATTRSTQSTNTERAASRPAQSQRRVESSGSSRQSTPSVSSSRSRESRESKASAPAKRSESSKEPESSKPARR